MNRLAGFRPNSEIIGKFRKLKKFYDHFVKRQKWVSKAPEIFQLSTLPDHEIS